MGAVQQAQTTATEAVQDAQTAAESAVSAAKTNAVQEVEAAAKPAQAAATKAEEAAGRATQAGIAASNAADDAKRSAGIATGAAGDSALNAENAQNSAQNAQQSATDAAESQSAAKASADAAAKSQQSAATDAKTATDAKVAAEGSADDAAAAAAAAGNAASSAEGSKQAAGASEEKAAVSERAAKESEQSAEKSAEAALESKNSAETSEENAAASAKKAQGVADSLPADYITAVNEIAALKTDKADKTELDTVKQQVESITPDDSTVGEKPWSSKNIVDMLCPPLEESGNPVVCYPVAGYPLGVTASWEPVQEGSGTPYPAGGGKNLFNPAWMPEKTIDHGVTWATTPDGTVTANGTSVGTTYYNSYNFLLPAGTYTTSAMSHFRVSILNNDTNDTITAQNVGQPRTFTVENDIQNARLFFAASDTLDNVAAKPQIEKGATATAYAPYENIRPIKGRESVTITRQEDSQVITLTLPETVYGGEVDAVTGEGSDKYYLIAVKGTERWNYFDEPESPNAAGYIRYSTYLSAPSAEKYDSQSVVGISSVGKTGNTSPTTNANVADFRPKSGILIFNVKASEKVYPLENWKAHLAAQYAAGTPVQICYKLEEPVPFTVTGAQPLAALAGANTVLTDADSATVTGRADPIKRIADLENKE